MQARSIRSIIVNHVEVDIAAPSEAVWRTIVEEYVDAKKFRELGYVIEPLDHPGSLPGSYRMRLEQDNAIVDERDCYITEFDEHERRLSLYAEYLSAPNGMIVFATYHATDTPAGARYRLDCHSRLDIELDHDDPALAVSAMQARFDDAMTDYLQSVKARLETGV